jgi:hypothetical protein
MTTKAILAIIGVIFVIVVITVALLRSKATKGAQGIRGKAPRSQAPPSAFRSQEFEREEQALGEQTLEQLVEQR